jgi:hypothetical protein
MRHQLDGLNSKVGGLDAKVSGLEVELADTKRQLDEERADSVLRIKLLNAQVNGLQAELAVNKRKSNAERVDLTRLIDGLTEELAATKRCLEMIHYRSALVTVRIMTKYAVMKFATVPIAAGPVSYAAILPALLDAGADAGSAPCHRSAGKGGGAQNSAASAAASSSGTAAAAPDSGLDTMRANVRRMFQCHANANVSPWFRRCSTDEAFLERTARNLDSVRVDRNDEVHPEPPSISRAELATIITSFSTGSPKHVALSEACEVMSNIFEEFFSDCLCK